MECLRNEEVEEPEESGGCGLLAPELDLIWNQWLLTARAFLTCGLSVLRQMKCVDGGV